MSNESSPPDVSPDKATKDASREFLLKEYDYFTESFHKNEEVGETRVNFFITFVTATIGGLVALINSDNGISGEPLEYVVIAGLFSLLLIGLVTMLRLLKRNKATDEFKDKLDGIRTLFKEHYDPEHVLFEYSPFKGNKKIRSLGGLVDFVAAINALLCAGLVAAIVYHAPDCTVLSVSDCIKYAKLKIGNTDTVIASTLITFFIALILQRIYIVYYQLTRISK